MLIGGVIGLISGILGIGGGVILSPVLLLLHWANMKETAALSAAFIFLNSIAGLAGATLSDFIISPTLYFWSGAAIIGGMAGAYFGSKRFNPTALKYVLSVVMVFAIFKLIIS